MITSIVGPPTSRGVANAPTASTNTRMAPTATPGSDRGSTTCRKVASGPPPRLPEASSRAGSMPWITGITLSTMNGRSTSARAITTPSGVNRSCRGSLDQPRRQQKLVDEPRRRQQDHPAVRAHDHAGHERDQEDGDSEGAPARRARAGEGIGDRVAQHEGHRRDGQGQLGGGQEDPQVERVQEEPAVLVEDPRGRHDRRPTRSGRSCSGSGRPAARRRRRPERRGSARAGATASRSPVSSHIPWLRRIRPPRTCSAPGNQTSRTGVPSGRGRTPPSSGSSVRLTRNSYPPAVVTRYLRSAPR